MGSKKKADEEKKVFVQLDGLLKASELADRLDVTTRTIRNYYNHGVRGVKLQRIKLGRKVYFDIQDVQLFMERIKMKDAV